MERKPVENRPHLFLSGTKSFKIIQTAIVNLLVISKSGKICRTHTLDNQSVWEQQQLTWNRHDFPSQRTTSKGNNTKKKERAYRNQQSNQKNSKNSKKKPSETRSKKSKNKDKKDKSKISRSNLSGNFRSFL